MSLLLVHGKNVYDSWSVQLNLSRGDESRLRVTTGLSRPALSRSALRSTAVVTPGRPQGALTKVMIEGFGWIYLVVVLDWHSKKVVGHYAGLQARAFVE